MFSMICGQGTQLHVLSAYGASAVYRLLTKLFELLCGALQQLRAVRAGLDSPHRHRTPAASFYPPLTANAVGA